MYGVNSGKHLYLLLSSFKFDAHFRDSRREHATQNGPFFFFLCWSPPPHDRILNNSQEGSSAVSGSAINETLPGAARHSRMKTFSASRLALKPLEKPMFRRARDQRWDCCYQSPFSSPVDLRFECLHSLRGSAANRNDFLAENNHCKAAHARKASGPPELPPRNIFGLTLRTGVLPLCHLAIIARQSRLWTSAEENVALALFPFDGQKAVIAEMPLSKTPHFKTWFSKVVHCHLVRSCYHYYYCYYYLFLFILLKRDSEYENWHFMLGCPI